MRDVIVIGLGPAGSTAARIASEQGLNVLGIDKAVFPRHKPCAAGLTARACRLLPMHESEYLEQKVHSIRIYMGMNKHIDLTDSEPVMITSKRETLDTALLRRAIQVGTEVMEDCRVKSLQVESGGVIVRTTRGNLKARFVIGCDGVNSTARKALHSRRQPSLPAWEAEVEIPDSDDKELARTVHFDLSCSYKGYGWIFPKKESISVGVAGNYVNRAQIDHAFNKMLMHLTKNTQTLQITRQCGHLLPLFTISNYISGNRVLLAGDAAGLVDAFLGEGLYYALVSGEIAGQWVVVNTHKYVPDYSNYRTELMQKVGRELIISKRLASIVYGMRQMMFYLAEKKPFILKEFSRALSQTDGYTAFVKNLPMPWRLYFWNI